MVVTEQFDPVADERAARYRVSEAESASEAIVAAFEQIGASGLENGSVLYDWIDPDALDQIFSQSRGNPHVDLELWGYPVRISNDTVTIYEPN